ncbi:putative flavin-dependent oxidoreductase [Pseudomonas aeruginosa]|nr:putative flavin-dependent oxidoreductase [Pseudomonas aeruginosa]
MSIELRGGVRALRVIGDSAFARQAARFLPDTPQSRGECLRHPAEGPPGRGGRPRRRTVHRFRCLARPLAGRRLGFGRGAAPARHRRAPTGERPADRCRARPGHSRRPVQRARRRTSGDRLQRRRRAPRRRLRRQGRTLPARRGVPGGLHPRPGKPRPLRLPRRVLPAGGRRQRLPADPAAAPAAIRWRLLGAGTTPGGALR